MSGPGGVGKGTVVAALVAAHPDDYWLSRSWTTRPQRKGEADDAYVFVDRPTFEAAIEAGGFVEYAEFLGNYYGTPVPSAPADRILIYEIDVQGAAQVVVVDPDALLVFLVAPSEEEQLARLRGRGDPEDKVRQRIDKARQEAGAAAELGAHVIVNESVDTTVDELHRHILTSFGGAADGRDV